MIRPLSLILFCLATLPAAARAQRRVDNQTVYSDTLPKLTIAVDSSLRFLGHIAFPVDTIAAAEEFVFGSVTAGRLDRALIVHFEHFLPQLGHRFQYPRLEMMTLGSGEYLHQTWGFADLSLFREPALAGLLHGQRIEAGRRWVMDRYVRALAEDPQYEVIIFYLEADRLSDPSISYGGMPVAPPPPPTPPPAVREAIVTRALAAFRIVSE
jgi:hypothetical protein